MWKKHGFWRQANSVFVTCLWAKSLSLSLFIDKKNIVSRHWINLLYVYVKQLVLPLSKCKFLSFLSSLYSGYFWLWTTAMPYWRTLVWGEPGNSHLSAKPLIFIYGDIASDTTLYLELLSCESTPEFCWQKFTGVKTVYEKKRKEKAKLYYNSFHFFSTLVFM